MPYILLVLAILAALFALYRFVVKASVLQIKTFFRAVFLGLYIFIMLFFAMTGRLPMAIILVVLAIPFTIIWYRKRAKRRKALPKPVQQKDDDESR